MLTHLTLYYLMSKNGHIRTVTILQHPLQNCYCACGHFWTSGTRLRNQHGTEESCFNYQILTSSDFWIKWAFFLGEAKLRIRSEKLVSLNKSSSYENKVFGVMLHYALSSFTFDFAKVNLCEKFQNSYIFHEIRKNWYNNLEFSLLIHTQT